jgi:hypothetical protein
MGSTINIESFTRFGTPKRDLSIADEILFKRSEILINMASDSAKGIIHGSGMKCSDFTGVPCSGEITVQLMDIPNELRWSCNVCGTEGVIKNWRKSPAYINSVRQKLREKKQEATTLRLSPEGYSRMKKLAADKADLMDILSSAAEQDGLYIIPISEFDIMRLIEVIAIRIEMRDKDRPELSALRDEIITSFARNSLI